MFVLQKRTVALLIAIVLIGSLTSGCVGGMGNPTTSTVTIYGTVQDETDLLDYIDVYLDNQPQRVNLKNGEGEFSFEVPSGSYQIWAWKGATGGQKNGVAIAPKSVHATKSGTVKPLEITSEKLHDFRFYTHNSTIQQINIPHLDDELSVAYGPSVKGLQAQNVQTRIDEAGKKNHSIDLQNAVIGEYSFMKVQFESERPTIYVPVYFMEQPKIVSPLGGASERTLTIEWHEVENATGYMVIGYKGPEFKELLTFGSVYDTNLKVKDLETAEYRIWVQAF